MLSKMKCIYGLELQVMWDRTQKAVVFYLASGSTVSIRAETAFFSLEMRGAENQLS